MEGGKHRLSRSASRVSGPLTLRGKNSAGRFDLSARRAHCDHFTIAMPKVRVACCSIPPRARLSVVSYSFRFLPEDLNAYGVSADGPSEDRCGLVDRNA
jgi:hypothetical protein